MASPAALAFVRSEEGLARLPPDARIVPLRPGLPVPEAKKLVGRPEDLLTPEDGRAIEGAVGKILASWHSPAIARSLTWRGVDLGACLDYELRLVALDLAKTAALVARAAARVNAATFLTDVPPLGTPFPPYPYLAAIGNVLETVAGRHGRPFRSLAPPVAEATRSRTRRVAQAYVSVASRQGVARLRGGRVVIAVGPHREFYLPLANAWKADRGTMIALTPTQSPIRPATKDGLFLVTPLSLVDRGERKELEGFVSAALQRSSETPLPLPPDEESTAIESALRTHIVTRLREWLPDLASIGIGFEDGLGQANGVVLMETGSPFSSAAVRYARKAGIRVTVLQHGVIAETFSYRLLDADQVAAWGELDAGWFRGQLRPGVRVEPTGSPRHDRLAGASAGPAASGLTRDRPTVLFASQPFVQGGALRSPWERAAIVAMVLEAGRRANDYRIVVKWHPSEMPERLPSPEDDALARSLHRANTLELLRGASAVLAVSSTVALEAMYLGRPVVFLGPPDLEGPFHPPEDGGGLRARNADELIAHLEALIRDPSVRSKVLEGQAGYLSRAYAALDGHASERVAALIRGS